MPAKKKTAKKKTAKKKTAKVASKKAGKKTAKAASKKSASGKTGAKKAASKKSASKETTAPAAAPAAVKSAVSSLDVNMGHVFALRPRVTTSFKPGDFHTAKHFLKDESYAKVEDAARAVAEKALELTNDAGSPHRRGRF